MEGKESELASKACDYNKGTIISALSQFCAKQEEMGRKKWEYECDFERVAAAVPSSFSVVILKVTGSWLLCSQSTLISAGHVMVFCDQNQCPLYEWENEWMNEPQVGRKERRKLRKGRVKSGREKEKKILKEDWNDDSSAKLKCAAGKSSNRAATSWRRVIHSNFFLLLFSLSLWGPRPALVRSPLETTTLPLPPTSFRPRLVSLAPDKWWIHQSNHLVGTGWVRTGQASARISAAACEGRNLLWSKKQPWLVIRPWLRPCPLTTKTSPRDF